MVCRSPDIAWMSAEIFESGNYGVSDFACYLRVSTASDSGTDVKYRADDGFDIALPDFSTL